MQPESPALAGLAEVVDRILDKGLIINADITVAIAGTELIGIKVRAAVASFATAARYGLEFPSGTNLQLPIWQEAQQLQMACPHCQQTVPQAVLHEQGCPYCGYEPRRPLAIAAPATTPAPHS